MWPLKTQESSSVLTCLLVDCCWWLLQKFLFCWHGQCWVEMDMVLLWHHSDLSCQMGNWWPYRRYPYQRYVCCSKCSCSFIVLSHLQPFWCAAVGTMSADGWKSSVKNCGADKRLVSDGCLKWNATCTALWKVTCFMVIVLRHHLMHDFGQAAGVFWTACTGRQLHYGLVECLIFHVCYIWIFNCWKNTVCRRNLPWVWNLRPGSLHVTWNYAIRYIMYDFL